MSAKNISSGSIKVNTDVVKTVANKLSKINSDLDKGYSKVEKTMQKVDSAWDGPASKAAISKFNSISKAYFYGDASRKKVLNEYIRFLTDAVALDYEITEKNNITLADMFK